MPSKHMDVEGARENVARWHDLLIALIESVEDERDSVLGDEREAVGLLSYMADQFTR